MFEKQINKKQRVTREQNFEVANNNKVNILWEPYDKIFTNNE